MPYRDLDEKADAEWEEKRIEDSYAESDHHQSKLVVTVDPTGSFDAALPERLVDACGILITRATLALQQEHTAGRVANAMNDQYAFPAFRWEDPEILADGTYRYDGDPDLKPMVKLRKGKVSVFIYQKPVSNCPQNKISHYRGHPLC